MDGKEDNDSDMLNNLHSGYFNIGAASRKSREVEDILKILDTSKATGPDCINSRLLREAAPILKYPLCKLFNISLSFSYYVMYIAEYCNVILN
jgi:hypothetical protein